MADGNKAHVRTSCGISLDGMSRIFRVTPGFVKKYEAGDEKVPEEARALFDDAYGKLAEFLTIAGVV